MPTVSVVMATYNGERFLAQQLASLTAQTFPPAELIVADDGSSDRTLDIVDDFRTTSTFPVRVIQNSTRQGYGGNFLNAARMTQGDYVAFCDQDDVWRPDKLDVAVQSLTRSGSSLFVHAARLIDESGEVFGSFDQGITRSSVLAPLTHDPWSVYYGFSMVFDRTLLTVIDPAERGRHTFEHHGLLSHDLWIYFLGTSIAETVVDVRPLVDYRRHRANATPSVSLRSLKAWTSSLGVAASPALRRDEIADHRSALLHGLSRSAVEPALQARARDAAEYWSRIAAHERSRLALYTEASLARRVVVYGNLSRTGAYRRAAHGGLGLRLCLKDLLAGVIGLRRGRAG
ncbi:glycosyltransferase [Modestobacter muralis]